MTIEKAELGFYAYTGSVRPGSNIGKLHRICQNKYADAKKDTHCKKS